MKPCIRDVEEITAANQWAKRQAEATAYREVARENMQRQLRKEQRKQVKQRSFARLCYVMMGASAAMIGMFTAIGEIGSAMVFGLILLAAIGGAVGNEQR